MGETLDPKEAQDRLDNDDDNPESFGATPAPELKVLSDEEKALVDSGMSISGAQMTVEEAGGTSTDVNASLLAAGTESESDPWVAKHDAKVAKDDAKDAKDAKRDK